MDTDFTIATKKFCRIETSYGHHNQKWHNRRGNLILSLLALDKERLNMREYALLVGVSHFKNGLESLAFVEDDINSMQQVLSDIFCLDNKDIHTLIDDSASCENILEKVETIKELLAPGDRVILYFATHGTSVHNAPYIASYEAELPHRNSVSGWLSTQQLLGLFHEQAANVIAFLDCCQSTSFFSPRSIKPDNSLVKTDAFPSKGPHTNLYTVAFAAAGVDENAYPDREHSHGCWTYYLLLALRGDAPAAFLGASNRITVTSLQEYLKSMVSFRVHSLYGESQTPYLWGTYSDDITIIEIPSRGRIQMRVGDIFFGEVDTDSEMKSVPSKDYLAKNYYDLKDISNKLGTKSNIEIVIGGKGTGKTYIGEYLEMHNENIIYQSVGAISLTDINNVTLTQRDEKGKYIDAWKYTLYTLLACSIVKRKKPGHDEFSNLLHQIYGDQADILLINPVGRRRIMFNKILKNSLRLSSDYKAYASQNGTTPLSNLTMLYEDRLNFYYTDMSICFLIDGLDEQLRGTLKDDQKAFLLDLLAAVSQSNEVFNQAQVILLFRNDILKTLTGEANLNKTFTAKSCVLSWLSSGDYKESPLYQLVEKRIQTSAQAAGCNEPCGLSHILPPSIKGANAWDWILDLTRHTPRDVIAFFNKCKELSKLQTAISETTMWDALRPYSDYLWNECQDILAGTCLASMSDALLALFNKLSSKYNVSSGNGTAFPYTSYISAYNSIEELAHIPPDKVLKTLYEAGVICIRTKDGRTYWYFRENPIEFEQTQWPESDFSIHKGLWKKVHIW